MLGVCNFEEFLTQIKSNNNTIFYCIAFPVIEIKKPIKGEIAIEFETKDDFLYLRDKFQINSRRNFNQIIKLFYESYLQRVCELLLNNKE